MLMNKRLKLDVELGDCTYTLENKFVFLSAWTIFTHHEISQGGEIYVFTLDTGTHGGEVDIEAYTSVMEVPPTHQYSAHSGMTLSMPFLVMPSLKWIYIYFQMLLVRYPSIPG